MMPSSAVDLPANLMSEDFNCYIAVDGDIQTAIKITSTDEELCAGLQAAGARATDTDDEQDTETTETNGSCSHLL